MTETTAAFLTRDSHSARLSATCTAAVVICALIAGVAALVTAPPSAAAQDWFSGIPGFGGDLSGPAARSDPPERKRQPPEDLRPNDIPWRSDPVLRATEKALERYRRIAQIGGWPTITDTRMMRAGDDDGRVPILRRRLRLSNDLAPPTRTYESETFDEDLVQAVRKFQKRHGLRVTGRVQRGTFAALNVSADARVAQLQLNVDRLRRLLNERIEERYILVNVPAYQLEAVENFKVDQRHRVIAGRPSRETPELRTTIRGVNFFPYWKVPRSIALKDLIPRMSKEPSFIADEGFKVVDGFGGPELDPFSIDWSQADLSQIRFQQDPGPKNALGLVRIDMTNEHGVYMHDTPMQNLFNQSRRAFSAGCVRVQGVYELVEWLARYEPGWDQPGQADAILKRGAPLDVTFARPVPVYFTYITAWGEPNAPIQFRSDVYDQDGPQELAGAMESDEGAAVEGAGALSP